MTGVLVLLSGKTWKTALKLWDRSSGKEGGKEELKERREQIWWCKSCYLTDELNFTDGKERRGCYPLWYTIKFHTTVLYVFGYKQHLSSHSDLFKSWNSSLNERTHFIFTSLHRNRAFLGTLVWCGTELYKDSSIRSLQTNMHIYIAKWRDANLDVEDVLLCP